MNVWNDWNLFRLIRQRHGQEHMGFVPQHARGVAFAAGVVGEHDIADFEHALDAVAGFDLPRAGQSDEVLPARRASRRLFAAFALNSAASRVPRDS